jgi:hypothetical protein
MNDHPGILSPESLPRVGEVALLTAIDGVLEAPAGELRTGSRSSGGTSKRRWTRFSAPAVSRSR